MLVQLCRCLYLRIKLFIYVRILLFIIFEVFRTIKISKFLFCGCFKVYFYILWVPIVTKGVTMPVVMTGSSEVITTCYDKRGRGCRYGGRLRLVIRVIRLGCVFVYYFPFIWLCLYSLGWCLYMLIVFLLYVLCIKKCYIIIS